jgi:hypothetical protein
MSEMTVDEVNIYPWTDGDVVLNEYGHIPMTFFEDVWHSPVDTVNHPLKPRVWDGKFKVLHHV